MVPVKTARTCEVCNGSMRGYLGHRSGVHKSCTKPGPIVSRPFVDDAPEVIEAAFQAAFKQVRQYGLPAVDMAWPSSLTRRIR